MATYHQIGAGPRIVTTEDGRIRFVIAGDYMAFGIAGEPLFVTEGGPPGRITAQLSDSDGSPLAENQWSPSIRFLPAWVEFNLDGGNEPDFHCRIELRDGAPRLVEIGYKSREGQAEIRQKHLRATEVSGFMNTAYRHWIIEVRDIWRDDPGGFAVPAIGEEQHRVLRNLVYDLRLGRSHVDTELLRQVAEVYRANFDKAPAAAVAEKFGVKLRMAHEYVRRAREREFLPPTTQGKKQI